MSKRKPKLEEQRRTPRVSVTIDYRTLQAYDRIQKRFGLTSLSAAIRYAGMALETEMTKA